MQKINGWSIHKKVLLIPLLLLLFCFLGYLLLVLMFCIPVSRAEIHLGESVGIIEREGKYPRLIDNCSFQLDNFTDTLMMMTAAFPSDNAWVSAVNASHYEGIPDEVFIDIYSGKERPETITYERYWHGYIVFLKPLLLFLNYGEIRNLLVLVQMFLFVMVALKLAEKHKRMVLPFFLFWIFLNPVATMLSLQFNTILIITLLSLLIILYMEDKWSVKDGIYLSGLFFFSVGVVTNYFDFLTYPLVTLGVPLTLWLSIYFFPSVKQNFISIVVLSSFWLGGYGGMWVCKWILGTLVSKVNVFDDAFETIKKHSAVSGYKGEDEFGYVDIIRKQLEAFMNPIWKVIIFALVLLFVYKILREGKINFNRVISYAILSFMPFVWYLVLRNHSYIHFWFTYRTLAILLFSFTALCMTYGKVPNSG